MYKTTYEEWLVEESLDSELKKELKEIINEEEISDRFYQNLAFGTGGLRGKMGVGTNRMNVHTVGKVTQGLANYLNTNFKNPSVTIGYDSRNKSDVFAEMAARVLVANKVKVYLFEGLRPTPMVSFAIRYTKSDAGIVITASHNPKMYNGYKVYGPDGGQLTDNAANETLDYINKLDIFKDVKVVSKEEAEKSGLLEYIGKEVDDAYYNKVAELCVRKELIKQKAKDLKIIYTPIHGSGNIPVRELLKRLGFTDVTIVAEQELPNGDFPTAPYPNPEIRQVFELAIELAKKQHPDVIFGTDPDCDRIGVVVNTGDDYKVLTGNQVGILLTDYLLGARKDEGKLETKDAIIKTIVTSDMTQVICDYYGVQMFDVLTGFKYIGERIKEFLETGSNNFVLGFEESYGYLAGDFVRDKDAVIASVLIAEMALYYKTQGKNLFQALEDLYKKHGYFVEDLLSIEMEGQSGQEKIKEIIDNLRKNPPKQIGDNKIVTLADYGVRKSYDLESGKETPINLPSSNVLKFILEDKSWFVVRPSGTEPKMKVYFSVRGKTREEAQNKVEQLKKDVQKLI
ncbi:phosphoglucomutase [Candidatus Epulonipiscium fishelsonii]|uniref:Phosphoglucomutase n=1 Tax=Candidatus Epulonipiscium fishelsonii TaxID=77094 RepID=A0ACC8X8U5_9FIRM|nr:phosphoglucomutase [Epulopiscium sp. SCG-B11WGA-EpuloA1]ONI39924.1 phosphoglucomutase [Epulopiscium sp. SCG-B05WGA-EpuloA1]